MEQTKAFVVASAKQAVQLFSQTTGQENEKQLNKKAKAAALPNATKSKTL